MLNLQELRLQKDLYFETDPHSPLTEEQRLNFDGLLYFSKNANLVFNLKVIEFEEKKKIKMHTSTGDERDYIREGKIKFLVDDDIYELTVYKSEHGYFIPFVDSNAGKITYGAGRYLDPSINEDGFLKIDFNLAYNPYCAYNENYSCPLPPAENRLSVAIKAGEMNFN